VSFVASVATCAGTAVAGGGIYTVATAVDPEPVSKTILAIGGFVVAGIGCAGSIISHGNSSTNQTHNEETIDKQTDIAERAFYYLQRYGEEEIIDGY